MAEPDSILDTELDAQLRGLFAQAEKAIEMRTDAPAQGKKETAAKTRSGEPTQETAEVPAAPMSNETGAARSGQLSLIQLLKPVVLGLEAVSRTTGDNTGVLKKLETAAAEATEAHKELPSLVADLRSLLEGRNTVSQSMFAALHEELKGYKDGFLLDSVHRPIIRDLISLFDDITEIQRQVGTAIAAAAKSELCAAGRELIERLRIIEINLEHNLGFISEVLNRLEVTLMPSHTGKLDKQTQRAVAVELAEDPDEDTSVVRSVKRGFLWKDRIFRAEEVVIKKWKEGFLVALAPTEQK
jgi:molecular chaperone GrpE (heat shock protein)